MAGKPDAAKVQVLSCRCIVRTYDGKVVVVNATCNHHHVHPDLAVKPSAASVPADDSPEFFEGTLMDGLDDEPVAARSREQRVQSGELPAETITELVDALRQSVSAAGAEASNIAYALERGDKYEIEKALDRLRDLLRAADDKMAMAMEVDRGR